MGAAHYSHKVANEILKLINSGDFPPGSRLPGERDLAEQLNVSRVSIREAKIVLQTQGRLETKAGSGAYVLTRPSYGLNGLPQAEVFELNEACALFEAEAAALAAPIITDETITELEALMSILSDENESELTRTEADAAFHNAIAQATNNQVIIFVIESMWEMRTDVAQSKSMCHKVWAKKSSHLEAEYHVILDALKRQDSSAARKAMKAHFTSMIEGLLSASEAQAILDAQRKASAVRSRFMLSSQLS